MPLSGFATFTHNLTVNQIPLKTGFIIPDIWRDNAVNAGAGAFSHSPPPILYSPFRTTLFEIFGKPQLLRPLTDVDITYGPISPVFLSSAMVKMYVFVDWACTFLKDEAMILYLLYTEYVRISFSA